MKNLIEKKLDVMLRMNTQTKVNTEYELWSLVATIVRNATHIIITHFAQNLTAAVE